MQLKRNYGLCAFNFQIKLWILMHFYEKFEKIIRQFNSLACHKHMKD